MHAHPFSEQLRRRIFLLAEAFRESKHAHGRPNAEPHGLGPSGSTILATTVALLVLACGGEQFVVRELVDEFPFARVAAEPAVIDVGTSRARRYLASGWSGDERDGDLTFVWGLGPESVLEFFLLRPRDIDLRFRCAPFTFPGAPAQTVAFALNGTAGPVVSLAAGMVEYRVSLPGTAAHAGWNHLVLRYAHARAPSDVTMSGDPRPLAVAWDFVRFYGVDAGAEPESDPRRGTVDIPAGTGLEYHVRLPEAAKLTISGLTPIGAPSATLVVGLESDGSPAEVLGRLDAGRFSGPVSFRIQRSGIVRLSLHVEGAPASGVRVEHPAIRAPHATVPAAARIPRGGGRPNVVVYLVDTMRPDRSGYYGHDRPTSPRLDRFARDAVVFTDAITDAPWTRPAVASLFTGLPARVHGVNGRVDAVPDEAETLAEVLHGAGYETAAFVTNGNVAGIYGFAQGYDVYDLLPGAVVPGPDGALLEPCPGSDAVNRAAIRWLDARHSTRPFLLYLHTADPHAPYDPPPAFAARLGVPEDALGLGSLATLVQLHAGTLRTDDGLVGRLLALYDAEIALNDERFGELLDELRRRGLYDDTVVVFLSDHGEEFHEHGGWEHGHTLYREITSVPLIIKLARGERAGTRVERLVQIHDVLPTLVRYLGIGTKSVAGPGMFDAADDVAVSHLAVDGLLGDALVDHRWKLVRTEDRLELYDRLADRAEQHDVAADHPVVVQYLAARLAQCIAHDRPPLEPRRAIVTDEVRRNLRALGYVE